MLTGCPLLVLSVSRMAADTILFVVWAVDAAPIDNDDAVSEVDVRAFILSLSCGGCDDVTTVVVVSCCCIGGNGGR